jgi:hypothetical protein
MKMLPPVKVRKWAPIKNPRVWSIVPVKNFNFKKTNLNHFIHFQLQNNAPICLQIPSKLKLTLGKSLTVALKYLIFAMQKGHPTGVIFYCSREVPDGSDWIDPVSISLGRRCTPACSL